MILHTCIMCLSYGGVLALKDATERRTDIRGGTAVVVNAAMKSNYYHTHRRCRSRLCEKTRGIYRYASDKRGSGKKKIIIIIKQNTVGTRFKSSVHLLPEWKSVVLITRKNFFLLLLKRLPATPPSSPPPPAGSYITPTPPSPHAVSLRPPWRPFIARAGEVSVVFVGRKSRARDL